MAPLNEARAEKKRQVEVKIKAAVNGICTELEKRAIKHLVYQSFAGVALSDVNSPSIEIKAEGRSHAQPERVRQHPPVVAIHVDPSMFSAGKIRIQVGDYGERKQFPERKAGFDFVAVVDEVERQIAYRKAKSERLTADTAVLVANEAARKRILRDVGNVPMSFISTGNSDGLRIEIRALNPTQAEVVWRMIKSVLGDVTT